MALSFAISREQKRQVNQRGNNKIPPSGSLSPIIQKKKKKNGEVVEYPKVEGQRVARALAFAYPYQFFWQYSFAVKTEKGGWKIRKINVPPALIPTLKAALDAGWSVPEILAALPLAHHESRRLL